MQYALRYVRSTQAAFVWLRDCQPKMDLEGTACEPQCVLHGLALERRGLACHTSRSCFHRLDPSEPLLQAFSGSHQYSESEWLHTSFCMLRTNHGAVELI